MATLEIATRRGRRQPMQVVLPRLPGPARGRCTTCVVMRQSTVVEALSIDSNIKLEVAPTAVEASAAGLLFLKRLAVDPGGLKVSTRMAAASLSIIIIIMMAPAANLL